MRDPSLFLQHSRRCICSCCILSLRFLQKRQFPLRFLKLFREQARLQFFSVAESMILPKVCLEIFILAALFSWYKPSKSASLNASNSSRVIITSSSHDEEIPFGLKYLAPGSHPIFLQYFGLVIFNLQHI